jgi:hypothetical protein
LSTPTSNPDTRELTINLDDVGNITSILAPRQSLRKPLQIMVKGAYGNIRMGNTNYFPTSFQPASVPEGMLFTSWPEGVDPIAYVCGVLTQGFWAHGMFWDAIEVSGFDPEELSEVTLSPIHMDMDPSAMISVSMTAGEALGILEDGMRHANRGDHRGTAMDLLGLLVDGQDADEPDPLEEIRELAAEERK